MFPLEVRIDKDHFLFAEQGLPRIVWDFHGEGARPPTRRSPRSSPRLGAPQEGFPLSRPDPFGPASV
jgi:hypothetical protein